MNFSAALPSRQPTPQDHQLMSEYHVLCFKPTPRLEWRGDDSQNGAEQFHHAALTLGDSLIRSNADGVFGTHNGDRGLIFIDRFLARLTKHVVLAMVLPGRIPARVVVRIADDS